MQRAACCAIAGRREGAHIQVSKDDRQKLLLCLDVGLLSFFLAIQRHCDTYDIRAKLAYFLVWFQMAFLKFHRVLVYSSSMRCFIRASILAHSFGFGFVPRFLRCDARDNLRGTTLLNFGSVYRAEWHNWAKRVTSNTIQKTARSNMSTFSVPSSATLA